jgi:hypothetical protein
MSKDFEPGLFDKVKLQSDPIAPPNSNTNRRPPPKKPVIIRVRRVPFNERLTCTVAEACDAAGLGRTKLYELFEGDMIESCTVGRRRLVKVPSLLKFLGIET